MLSSEEKVIYPPVSMVFRKIVLDLCELLVLVDRPRFYTFSEISKRLECSLSSVSRAVDELLAMEFLVVEEVPLSHTGRPSKTIRLNYRNNVVKHLADFIEAYHSFLHSAEKTKKLFKA